ncbi:MAG TPA: hypothetical protein VM871_11050, partial [Flavisolibacter sp.]|nr:hypothetical protein [Flavisolibacter sp.]
MKYIRCLTLFLASSFTISQTNAQVAQPDEMVKKIFSTLQTKDEKAFVALYPNAAQFSKMMRTMMVQVLNSPEVKQAMAMDPTAKNMNIDSMINTQVDQMSKPEAFAEMQKKFSRNFQDAIEKGEKKGVNWNEAKLTSFTTDTTAQLDGEMEALKSTGIKAMTGMIDFRSGTTDYQMKFEKVMYIPAEGGWFGGEFSDVMRKGEKETGETASVDSVAT